MLVKGAHLCTLNITKKKYEGKKKLMAKKNVARSLNVTEPCEIVIGRIEPIGSALV